MCEPNGRSTGFLCPNGTIFNQQYFVCDWWYNLDCAQQQDFYNLNQFLYQENDDEDYDYGSLGRGGNDSDSLALMIYEELNT